MWTPVASTMAAVLCLLASAPRTAHAQDCGPGFTLVGDSCRPCGGLGNIACPDTGCDDGLAENAGGRCRECGDLNQLVCIGDDGAPFCTGDRVIPGEERCDPCGSFGRSPCPDEDMPCDAPDLFPAPDDNDICRPCGGRFRTCCPAETGETPCRFDVQECIDGFCLRCNVPDPDPGCPGFTGELVPPPPPFTGPPPECEEGTTANSRGGCSPCGEFAQLVCVGEDGERFCTGDRLLVGPLRCDPCGSFGQPPCLDEDMPCDAPDLFPAPDDNDICRPCGGRFRTCCPAETGESPCRFDVQECVDGFCLRCNVPDPDPGCPGVEEAPVGPEAATPPVPEPPVMMLADVMMDDMAPGPAPGPMDAMPAAAPAEAR